MTRQEERAIEWGRRFRRRREEMQLSQEAVARRIGVVTATISRWENGRSLPRNYEAMNLMQLLHMPTPESPKEDNPVLQETLQGVRDLYAFTGGQGPAWEYLLKQLAWVRYATTWGLKVDRRAADREVVNG